MALRGKQARAPPPGLTIGDRLEFGRRCQKGLPLGFQLIPLVAISGLPPARRGEELPVPDRDAQVKPVVRVAVVGPGQRPDQLQR